MLVRKIIRGDSYALRRPLYVYTFVEESGDELIPFNLVGCTVRTTFRTGPASISEDPNDESAIWKGTISINSDGVPTYTDGMALKGVAADGTVEVHITADVSRTLPLNTELISDLEVTDAQGEKFTFLFDEKIVAVDGHTHREVN